MLAGSTRPSQPRHHWMFQLMSFIDLLRFPRRLLIWRSLALNFTGRAVKRNLPCVALRAGLACVAFALAPAASAHRLPHERIKLTAGFEIRVFYGSYTAARCLA